MSKPIQTLLPRMAQCDSELVIDNFAGGGGASTGISQAIGRSVDIAINHDMAAISMHQVNHPDTHHYCENILEVDPVEVCKGRPVGMAWFSPDCFPAGTLILTQSGYKPIESIEIGDLVLTHTGNYRPVTTVMSTTKPVLHISGQGCPPITVSHEHPFYIRNAKNVWNNKRRAYDRTLGSPEWRTASELSTDGAPTNAPGGKLSFWATPCVFPKLPIPLVPGRGFEISDKLLWLCGRYVGDGWTRLTKTRAELVIVCSPLEADDLRSQLSVWPRTATRSGTNELTWHERITDTAIQFSTNHRGLVEWLRSEFGHRAHNKRFPSWAFGMSDSLRQALLDGYCSADGHSRVISGQVVTEIQTVSKALAYSVRSLVESLGMTAHIHGPYDNRATIQGRAVNASPIYGVRWRESNKRKQNVRDGIHNWLRIQRVEDRGKSDLVYNLSVQGDESYVADGVVVHNCTHHSKAKGGKPRKKEIRGLAWNVVRWAAKVKPRVIFLENVEEFQDWGPLKDGQPIKARKGETFRRWKSQLEALGYAVEYRTLVACDYGAPTTRKRLFLVARRDGEPILWPEPTHGPKKGLKPYRTAGECIDWSIPCPSIFERKRPLVENTMRRIAKGIQRYVIDNPEPFIIAYHSQETFRGQPLDEPLRTQTTENRFGLVTPFVAKHYGGVTGHGVDRPLGTVTTVDHHSLVTPYMVQTGYGERPGQQPRCMSLENPLGTVVAGGQKHALVSPVMVGIDNKSMGAGATWSPDDPLRTITTENRFAMATAFLSKFYGTNVGSPMDAPMPTITSGGNHLAEVRVFLVKYYGAGEGQGCDEPLHTITTQDRFGLVTVAGQEYQIVDIGMRMLQPHELAKAQGLPDGYILQGTKTQQVRMIGNSVSPHPARALVAANYKVEMEVDVSGDDGGLPAGMVNGEG